VSHLGGVGIHLLVFQGVTGVYLTIRAPGGGAGVLIKSGFSAVGFEGVKAIGNSRKGGGESSLEGVGKGLELFSDGGTEGSGGGIVHRAGFGLSCRVEGSVDGREGLEVWSRCREGGARGSCVQWGRVQQLDDLSYRSRREGEERRCR
jgi:hypothetical protein